MQVEGIGNGVDKRSLYNNSLTLKFLYVFLIVKSSPDVTKHTESGWSTNEDFCFCSRYNNVNNGTWHVYKPSFGSFVATFRLACSEI